MEMDGFYSREESANILGITIRQLTNYLKAGKLRKLTRNGKVWIPQEDVRALYEDNNSSPVPSRREFHVMEERVEQLERTIEVLKRGMGFGAPRNPLNEGELMLLYHELVDLLGKSHWEIREIARIADLMVGLTSKEMHQLVQAKGITAWSPLFDLCNRMVVFVEKKEDYPLNGLGALSSRIEKAKNRLLGLIHVATALPTEMPSKEALELKKQLDTKPGMIDSFVQRYIQAEIAKK